MLLKTKTKVDKLTERVESIYDQKQADEDKRARSEARLKQIREAAKWVKTDFWCNKHGDTTGIAVKVVFGADSAYYESIGSNICREDMACCKGLRRRITDKQFDPYFTNSMMIKKQQQEAKDNGWLLQPNDSSFDWKYPQYKKKLWAKQEADDKAKWTKKIMI